MKEKESIRYSEAALHWFYKELKINWKFGEKKLLVEYFFNKFADRQGAPEQLYSKWVSNFTGKQTNT